MSEAWAPTTVQVADYVTSRTLDLSNPGSDTPVGDFTTGTYPTAAQVGRLIDGSTAWVKAALAQPLLVSDVSLVEIARTAAAIRAAGMVELTYPERDGDLNTSKLLLDQAASMLEDLNNRNTSRLIETGAVVVDPSKLVPQFSMPSPVWWGDINL